MSRRTTPFRQSLLARSILAALLATPFAIAHGQTADNLGTVQAGAQGGTGQTAAEREKAKQESAPHQAITQGSLKATEPKSIISRHVIENNNSSASNYSDIISIAPSVISIDPNGPGLMESQGGPVIRGFQDGQYNVTFDGIPWGDSNDFTHHTTSYFMPQDIGSVVVDRGPGDASNIGPATFGGTVAIHSKEPLDKPQTTFYGTMGSFDTRLLGAEFDTGVMKNYGDMRAFFDYRQLQSNGYLSGTGLDRKNLFIKAEKPVGDNSLLTFAAMKNDLTQHFAIGATSFPYVAVNSGTPPFTSSLPGQMQIYGSDYGMSGNPQSQAYSGYNYDDISTDFEYIGLKTNAGPVKIDNKVYTYAYYHSMNNTNDPSLAQGSLGVYDGLPGNSPIYNDVAGQSGAMDYRSWGDVFKAEGTVGKGTLRGGLWVDYQWNYRFLQDVNWSLGGTPDTSGPDGPNGIQRNLRDDMTTIDPFVEYEYHPTDAWTITPGVRYMSFNRNVNGAVLPSTGGPGNLSKTYDGAQPSIYANYRLAPSASVYAQWARGFLAPKDASVFYDVKNQGSGVTVADPGAETTNNLQAGSTWKTNKFTVSGDVYYIRANNFAQLNGAGTKVNQFGNTVFKGVELEGTYALGYGFNLYANYSYNKQNYADGTPVQFAPNNMYTAGLIYDQRGWYGSVIAKHIGSTYQGGNNGPLPGGVYQIPGYTITNLSLGYTIPNPTAGVKDVKIRFLVSDLSNNESIYYVYGATLGGTDMFMTLPGRSYMLGGSVDF